MEIRKVFQAGNSLVVSLPRNVVKALSLSAGMPLAIEVNEDKKQVTMQVVELGSGGGQGSKYAQMVEEFIDRYEAVLRELS